MEGPAREMQKDNVIILISDDDDDDQEGLVEQMEIAVKEEPIKLQEGKETQQEGASVEKESGESARSRDTLLCFIKKYCRHAVDINSNSNADSLISALLGPSHPKDIVLACFRSPYCLYLYQGVELDGGGSTSVVLIGFTDQSSGQRVVKLLQTFQTSVDTDTDTHSPNADAQLLIETLKKLNLHLLNLAVFYCNAPHPGSEVFVSRLQAFNPHLISFCGLPGMIGRVCQAGLLRSFLQVVDLIGQIYQHFFTCPSASKSLMELLSAEKPYNPYLPVSAQGSFIIHGVQKIINCWQDLAKYFRLTWHTEDAQRIGIQMKNHKIKLHFLFLLHALGPLKALKDLGQDDGDVDPKMQLQVASKLVNIYATKLIKPDFMKDFLRRRDLRVLDDSRKLLSLAELSIGPWARDFLWATAVVDLGEEEREDFLHNVRTFYRTVVHSLGDNIPQQLGNKALKHIYDFQKNPEYLNKTNKSPITMLSDFGRELGLLVCEPGQDKHPLLSNFLFVVRRVKALHKTTGEDNLFWAKVLQGFAHNPALQRIILTFVAFPRSLSRDQVFAQVSVSREVTPESCRQAEKLQRRKMPFNEGQDANTSSENEDRVRAKPRLMIPAQCNKDTNDSTDNSSDWDEITEDSKPHRINRLMERKRQTDEEAECEVIISSDEDERKNSTSKQPAHEEVMNVRGQLVWGQKDGFCLWPAIMLTGKGDDLSEGMAAVDWYGLVQMSSQVNIHTLKPFSTFSQHFSTNSFATLASYREAIFLSLQEAAERCKKQFNSWPVDRDELLKEMLDWAFGGFKPSGPDGLRPLGATNCITKPDNNAKVNRKHFLKTSDSRKSEEKLRGGGGRAGEWEEEMFDLTRKDVRGVTKEKGFRGGKVQKKKTIMPSSDGFDDDDSPNFVPYKRRIQSSNHIRINETKSVYTQPDQKVREETIRRIMEMKLDIEGFCLCCGSEDVDIFHPLFEGGLCLKCKDNLRETLYRYDDDGYQSYCTICCYGLEVILCGNDSCCRSYCEDCLNILVSPGTFDSLKELDPWICFLCQPHRPHGALTPRQDWSVRVQEVFANNSAMMFEPHRVYPSIPANLRRPIRVLSLFDGIATGFLVLKDLGFKVEKYVASEICEDSLAVASVNHFGKIIHVGDARAVTPQQLEEWGPFDLLIGGSPCNDLSIVNPYRKGLYEGTGRLFFEYYRVLQLLKPKEEDPRPFFWLFENVVFMNIEDKQSISRFLECNPVLVDAVKVSPAHRARCFWGNIPGMSRPIVASQTDKQTLQECLEPGREARVEKVRTITTNRNSLKQGKDVSLLPVLHNGREDNIWITELEKIFGFPKHYTDVRDMNKQQRQKVLGKSWSVPVIRHLFAPLKDYFSCEELPHLPTTTSSSSSSPPDSPDVQQLR